MTDHARLLTTIGCSVIGLALPASADFIDVTGEFDFRADSFVNPGLGQVDDSESAFVPIGGGSSGGSPDRFIYAELLDAVAVSGDSFASISADVFMDVSATSSYFEATVWGSAFAGTAFLTESFLDLTYTQRMSVDRDTLVDVRVLVEAITQPGMMFDPRATVIGQMAGGDGPLMIENDDGRAFFREITSRHLITAGSDLELGGEISATLGSDFATEIESLRLVIQATVVPTPATLSLLGAGGLFAARRRR